MGKIRPRGIVLTYWVSNLLLGDVGTSKREGGRVKEGQSSDADINAEV